jgi:hypothetical protein
MRRFATAPSRSLRPGALCLDATFRRVLGTRGVSEPILAELLGAWRAARSRGRVRFDAPTVDAALCDPAVFAGTAPRGLGDLVVDVRARDSDEHFVVEVQHRAEKLFPHRAVLYAAAELVAQHVAKGTAKPGAKAAAKAAAVAASEAAAAAAAAPSDSFTTSASLAAAAAAAAAKKSVDATESSLLLPVHTLAFCDYSFQSSARRTGGVDERSLVSVAATLWRGDSGHARDSTRALQFYSLLPDTHALKKAKQKGNEALDCELAARMSFVFALLPHAPALADLTKHTPPLLRWASLVAHASPENLSAVPNAVRSRGVECLLEQLESTAAEVERERASAEADDAFFARTRADAKAEGEAKGKAEGKAKGKAEGEAEGKAEALRLMGVVTIEAYRERFGVAPPPLLAPFLAS